jgi:oxygen-dependent protoporphyrinogen oxidase
MGGGLAGLVAARDLLDAKAQVTLFEAASLLGGQVRTRRDAGFVVEDGAEGWVSADTEVPQLCTELGLAGELVRQIERRSLFLSRGTLSELDPGAAAKLLGIQANEADLGGGITSLRGGMGSLIEALERNIRTRASVRLGSEVVSAAPTGAGWRLHQANGESNECDALVAAAPAPAIARLIDGIASDVAGDVQALELASNASVSLGYERSVVGCRLDASGIVVDPKEELEGLRACAFSSSKFPGRAPPGHVLLRAFFRPRDSDLNDDDAAWQERATRLLGPALGISGKPVRAWAAHWPKTLPQYSPSYNAIVARVTRRLRKLGFLQLAGTSFHPGGVPGAVRSGHAAARALLSSR